MSADSVAQWDPTVPSPLEMSDVQGESQRRTLFDIREKLQRAMIVSERFNCVETAEPTGHAGYVPVQAASHRVLGDNQTEVLFASNHATSLLLSRQFEGISRKDIIIQEYEERLALVQSIHANVMLLLQREHATAIRRAQHHVASAEAREAELRSTLATRVADLEASCRRRTESVADECMALLNRDLSRAQRVGSEGHSTAQRNWLEQEEERARASFVLEFERGLSRIYARELSDSQGLRTKGLLDRKVPLKTTALIDADDSSARAQGSLTDFHSDRHDFIDADLQPACPAPHGIADSETSSAVAGDNPNTFTPYWGWMFKSTGVLMTWQRRFFVFTTRGKLKCSASDKGPWNVLVSANNIMRVEVDSYHDTAGGVAPPTSQYHQYGFYIDAFDAANPAKPKRLRFCCFCRRELNAWLTVLRRATDVVFALEESGSIARSPARRHLDLSDSKARLAISNLSQHHEDGATAPTYRKRTQLEEDVHALEFRQRLIEERSRHRDALHKPSALYNAQSEVFGRPPAQDDRSSSPR